MIGVASADVLPNLRNGKQLSDTTDLDVEVFSPKIMRFGIMDQLLHSGPENLKKSRQKKNSWNQINQFHKKKFLDQIPFFAISKMAKNQFLNWEKV